MSFFYSADVTTEAQYGSINSCSSSIVHNPIKWTKLTTPVYYFPLLFRNTQLKTKKNLADFRRHPHLFIMRSVSRSLRMDLPSMSGGTSIPAMSRMVGAKSMFNTMWGLLWKQKRGSPFDIMVRNQTSST